MAGAAEGCRLVGLLAAKAGKTQRLGTDRTLTTRDALRGLVPLLSKFGITRVADVTGLDKIGIPVTMVCRPNSSSLDVYQGKGLDLAAAKVSGIMESIERYQAEQLPSTRTRLATLAEVAARQISFDIAKHPGVRKEPLDDRLKIAWVDGVDLMTDGVAWLPYALVKLDFTRQPERDPGQFQSVSTGLAAGGHLLEALVHAVCEVIERDATTLWRLYPTSRQDASRLDLDQVNDAVCRELIERIEGSGLSPVAWDITSDIRVPTILCRIIETSETFVRPYYVSDGCGCHPRRDIALARAITEAAQGRLTLISGARDDLRRHHYVAPDPTAYERQKRLAKQPRGRWPWKNTPSFESDDFGDDLNWLVARLADAGIQSVVAVDLSPEKLPLYVVKVLIPGLEDGEDLPGYVLGRRAIDAYYRYR